MSRSRLSFRPIALAATVSLAALLAGCTVGPNFEAPKAPEDANYTDKPVPGTIPSGKEESQHFKTGADIQADWWALFHSPDLDSVIKQAIAGNRNLVQARATLMQAHQQFVGAQGGLLPQVDFNAGAERQKLNYIAEGIPFPPETFNVYTVGLNVKYDLDIFGGTKRQIEQRAAQAEMQNYELVAAYLTLTGNAVNQVLTIAAIREQLKAADDIIANDEQNLGLVKRTMDAGEGTQFDVEAAQSQLENDRALVPSLRQQLSVARHALAILVGQSPGTWSAPDFDLKAFTLPADLPVTLPSELVHQRPDILAAESQLHAASAAIGIATAQLYPNISLSAAVDQFALTPGTLFMGAGNAWSFAAGLAAPIFHGGELEAQRKAMIAAFDGAKANYEQTVLQSFGQVANVLEALQHDGELIEAQRRALDAAERSLKLVRTSYDGGNIGILRVLDAQRLYQEARLGYVRAESQRYIDTAQLFAAMGGGWRNWKGAPEPVRPANAPADLFRQLFTP